VVSPRALVSTVLAVGGLVLLEGRARAATASTNDQSSAQPSAAPAPASLAGFDVLVSGGFATSTMDVYRLHLEPYGGTFGLDTGYTFGFGLRLGAYFEYSLGQNSNVHYNPLIGRSADFVAVTSSMHGGMAIGWDVPVSVLVLRYALSFGFSSMKWDFGDAKPIQVRFGNASNPTVGFHFAPGLALLYGHGLFQGGVGFDYFVQTSGTIPSGVLGRVLVGVKF
jgi:hypothetical protein